MPVPRPPRLIDDVQENRQLTDRLDDRRQPDEHRYRTEGSERREYIRPTSTSRRRDVSHGDCGEQRRYDTPGTGPHRFGVDNKRKLAFLPNNAPGWNKRVIWTLDIKDPLKPEVISQWGLPWMKADGEGETGDAQPHEEAVTLHGPPMIRGNRMYCAWWGGGISVIDCTDLPT